MVTWQWTLFEALAVEELYTILAARQAVFVVEQRCAYQDIDGLDAHAWHLLGWETEGQPAAARKALVAYARVVFPGQKYAEPSIGRVLTTHDARGRGFGKALLTEALRRVAVHDPAWAIRISAQQYLEHFYQAFGFRTVSAPYDEDGIPHLEMVRAARPATP